MMNELNEMLKPGNLVPGPGSKAIAFSMTGTVSRVGTNGMRCELSGAGVVRIPIKGMSFNKRGLTRGFTTLVSTVIGTGPTTTGKRCLEDMAMTSAVKPNIGVGPTGVTRWWGY